MRRFFPSTIRGAGGSLYDLSGESGWLHCYSFAKRFPAYSGSSLRVIRDSDSTELDIGFVDDLIDVSAIETFCSGTTGRVKIFYDQFGTNNLNGIGTVRPIIYSGGVFLGFISNDGINAAFEFSSGFTLAQDYTVIASLRKGQTIINQRSGSPNAGSAFNINAGGGISFGQYGVNTFTFASGVLGLQLDGPKKYLSIWHENNTSVKISAWVDGGVFIANASNLLATNQNVATTVTKVGIGLTTAGVPNGNGLLKLTELFLFSIDQTANTDIFDKRYIPEI